MSAFSHLSRNRYLLVHDALREVAGPQAHLAAFVKQRKPFQCDMLINSPLTDPALAAQDPQYVSTFAKKLQEKLGTCSLMPRKNRIDIVFRDRQHMMLALGASREAIDNIQTGADINHEPEYRRRPRLRISLGFDEELFQQECDFMVNLAARSMEKFSYTYIRHTGMLEHNLELQQYFVDHGGDYKEIIPPVLYWQIHGYLLAKNFYCRTFQEVQGTIARSFAKYYGELPLLNPFCEGEDLNTINVVRWLCEAWKLMPVEEQDRMVVLQSEAYCQQVEAELRAEKEKEEQEEKQKKKE